MAYRFPQAYLLTRLPKHYLQHRENLLKPQSPVHYIPEEVTWKKLPHGRIIRVENVPLPLLKIPQEDKGIWGGEAVIKGFKKKPRIRRNPHFWFPALRFAFVYSEILNKHLKVILTQRAQELIDQHYGFDNYILKTPVQDLRSQLALDIRRKMLLALVKRDLWHDEPEKQEKIYAKYKDCIIPEEEAEWFGLSLLEALRKQRKIEVELAKPVPYKIQFRKELLQQLQEWKLKTDDKAAEETSWFPKLNLFGKKEAS